jgi:type I restriction enzyme S subunit
MTGEWRAAALGDVLQRITRMTDLDADESYRTIGIRLRAAGLFIKEAKLGSQISAKRLALVEPNDIVYSRLFAWRGAFGVADTRHAGCVASNEFPTYRATADLLPPFFAIWASQTWVWEAAEVMCTGTTPESRNRLSEDDFLSLEIDLPPIEEQQRIVRAVRSVDLDIARTEKKVQAIRDLLLAAQASALGTLQDDEVEIGEVAKVRTGGTPSRSVPDYFGGDVPWVKTGDIRFRDLIEASETITEAGVKASSAKVLPAGTVVLAMIGQGATRGRAAVLTTPMATNQNSAAIQPSEKLDPRFLLHWFWLNYEELRGGAEGTSYPALNKGLVEEMSLPLPDVSTQHDIAARLDAITDALFSAEDALEAKKEFRPALVSSLLSANGENGSATYEALATGVA